MKEILETAKYGEYDLIVCGGGVAGAAAAVSAKRNGLARVLLIEKQINLGGLATCGLISWYEPICDGKGKRFSNGMAEELFERAMNCGPDKLPSVWRNGTPTENDPRCSAYFSPNLFSIDLDLWLEEENVELLLDTLVVAPVMDGNVCNGIIVENKTGRGFYAAKSVVDCTGDLDIMYRAGIPCANGENYLTYIAYITDTAQCQDGVSTGNMLNSRRWTTAGSNLCGGGHPDNYPKLSGVTAEEVTKYVRDGKRIFMKNYHPVDKNASDITVLPSMAQFRTTRRLIGEYTLTENDLNQSFTDSIGRVCDFAHRAHLYEIPYRCLYHCDYPNIFTAGRSISSAGWAWEVTRVIPGAVLTGQAAGVAAALCVAENKPAAQLNVKTIQNTLQLSGVHLHIDE